ncbi:MAG: dihydrofolate reductase [Salinisphaeraceae bacterium]|nr:dihydrofolate reductase [Salinisphaeraceae bacterium]
MKTSLIVAMDENGLIGSKGDLPWRLPADLGYFKRKTVGKAILMGRKTHDSIGRPLPKRRNIVLTRKPNLTIDGCDVVEHVELARSIAARHGVTELVVIGGAEIYRLCLPEVSHIYLTRVHGQFEGDTWFPELDWAAWREIEREERPADEKNPHACSFIELAREHASTEQ